MRFLSTISSRYVGFICCKGPTVLGSRLARSSENAYSGFGEAVVRGSVYTEREANGAIPCSSGYGV